MVLDHDAEETQYKLLYKQTTDENIKNLLIVVGKFVILMLKLGERFGVSKIKRVIFKEYKNNSFYFIICLFVFKSKCDRKIGMRTIVLNVTFHSLVWALISKLRRFIALRLSISKTYYEFPVLAVN